MMTKDKKPFTYTPGGLDLSQIKTPSMARRLNQARQQQEDQENPAYFRQPSVNGGPSIPAPPPPPPPGPPPPPPLVISVTKPTKVVSEGERPEIVIPENPIGMLRKTNSPYHWKSEESGMQEQGSIPRFVDKSATPSPVAPQMRRAPPQQFSQQPPQASPQYSQQPPQYAQQPPQQYSQQSPQQQYSPQSPQNYAQASPQLSSMYENNLQQQNNKSASASPVWKPEPKYPNSAGNSPTVQQNQTPTKDSLQRQDSQFNLSPSPWGKNESPFSNASSTTTSSSNQTISPSCDTRSSNQSRTPISSSPASPWKQDTRGSPMPNNTRSPAQSPYSDEYRVMPIQIEARETNTSQPKSPAQVQPSPQNAPAWRHQPITPNSQPMSPVNNNHQINNTQPRSPAYAQSPGPAYTVKSPSPPKQNQQYSNMSPDAEEVRYKSHMTIPVTPRKVKSQNDEEDCTDSNVMPSKLNENPDNLPWVRGQSAVNKSTPAPPWCQKTEGRKSLPRETVPQQSPQSSEPQPPWVTDENRRYETLPRQANKIPSMPSNQNQIIQNVRTCDSPGRVIPIQMEVSKQEISQNNNHIYGVAVPVKQGQGQQGRNQQQPQLRIIIDMNQQGAGGQPQVTQQQGQVSAGMQQRGQPHLLMQGSPHIVMQQQQQPNQQARPNPAMQQPQQHISRVLTPQMMRMDGATPGTPLRQEPPSVSQQSKTRIIPIQMEPSSPGVNGPR